MSARVRRLELGAEAIPAAVDAVRARGDKVITNWFFSPPKRLASTFATEASIVFVDAEEGLERLYYVTTDVADLEVLLGATDARPAVCDHFGRVEIDPALRRALEAADLRPVASYLRIRRTRRAVANAAPREVSHARPDEVDELHGRLREDFDVLVDYVPARRDLVDLVDARRVIVRRSAQIDGYLVSRIEGRSARWDFIGTRPGAPPAVASALLADFESELAALGVEIITGWVDARREALVATYAASGYRRDGLVRTTFAAAALRSRARASAPTAIASRPAAVAEGARASVIAALEAVNAAIPPAMRVALDDDASLEALDSLALMNLLVGTEQAVFDASGLEIEMTTAARIALDGPPSASPIATVGRLVGFAEARVAAARR